MRKTGPLLLVLSLSVLAACSSAPSSGPIDPIFALAHFMSVEPQLATNSCSYSPGQPTKHSSVSVPDKVPNEDGTDIVETGVMGRHLDAQQVADLEARYPEGDGPNGHTVKASMSSLTAGYYLFAYMKTAGPIPANDRGRYYQYATVLDRDNDSSNNYVPGATFAKDFFRDSDTWIEYTNEMGVLGVKMTDAQNNNIQPLSTDTMAIIAGNTLVFVIPMIDIPTVLPCFAPVHRMTAFCHGGDFGINPPHDWSGSVRPDQLDPLNVFSTEARLQLTPRIQLRADYVAVDDAFVDMIGMPETFAFADSPFLAASVLNGHMQTITTSSDFTGGKGAPAINVIPAMFETCTFFPCLRPGPLTGNPASAFVGVPVGGEFKLDDMSRWRLGPSAWSDGSMLKVPTEAVAQDPIDILGAFMSATQADALLMQATTVPSNVHIQKQLEIFDGQLANVLVRNEEAAVSDLRPDFQSAVSGFDPTVTIVRAGIPLVIEPHVTADFSGIVLTMRVDSKAVTFETMTPVNIDGVDHNGHVPFTQPGRLVSTITIPDGHTVLLAGQRNFGQTQVLRGVPILAEIPLVNRPNAASAEIPPGKNLMIMITPAIVKDPG